MRIQNIGIKNTTGLNKNNNNNNLPKFTGIPGVKRQLKVLNLASQIFGTIEETISKEGFRYITKRNKNGIRIAETKIYPSGNKAKVAYFEANGKTPTHIQTFEKEGRKWRKTQQADYAGGQFYFKIQLNKDKSYKSDLYTSNTQLEIETGTISKRNKCIPKHTDVFETYFSNKFKEPRKSQKADGVRYRIKAENLEKLVHNLNRKGQPKGDLFIENPYYNEFATNTMGLPSSWIVQNLNNVKKIPVTKVSGSSPKDIIDVFFLKSSDIKKQFAQDFKGVSYKIMKKITRINSSPVIKSFWDVAAEQRAKNDFSIFADVLPIKEDPDFIKLATYLREYSTNTQISAAFNNFISNFNIKTVDLTEKNLKAPLTLEVLIKKLFQADKTP